MTVYFHRTSTGNADRILTGGFENGAGGYLTRNEYRGVWISTVPLDINDGLDGDTLLTIEISETEVAPFEWREAEKRYREFLVPSEILNRHGKVSRVTSTECA